jgi:hypothetical protein
MARSHLAKREPKFLQRLRQRLHLAFAAPTPSDFLDDNAVVAFAFAVTQASLEHRSVNREERQFLPNLARLRDHEARVFERLTHTAFGRKVARHHFWSLSVHHLRGRRRGPGDIEECGLVEAEPRGKYQTFGQRQAIKPEDQIEGELGAAAIADFPCGSAWERERPR